MYIGELEPSHLRKDSTNKFRIMSTPNGGWEFYQKNPVIQLQKDV